MITCKLFNRVSNEEIKGLMQPITWGSKLDERLDECYVEVRGSRTAVFTPCTEFKLVFSDGTEEYYVLGDCQSIEVPNGSGYYNHTMHLLERTKLLEGVICQSITFTNSGNVDKTGGGQTQWGGLAAKSSLHITGTKTQTPSYVVTYDNDYDGTYCPTLFKSKENISFPTVYNLSSNESALNTQLGADLRNYDGWTVSLHIYDVNGAEVYSNTNSAEVYGSATDNYVSTPINLPANSYVIKYFAANTYSDVSSTITWQLVFSYNVAFVPNARPLKKITCADVIDRILLLCEPLFGEETPRFSLSSDWRERIEEVYAPEFSMTQCNLREQLKVVGGFLHLEPRLTFDNKITFDEYGGNEPAFPDGEPPYVYNGVNETINSYASEIDSSAENIVNALDNKQGVLSEPVAGAYKSLRTESVNVRINEENGVIETLLPVYGIVKITCRGYDISGTEIVPETDITKYLFEKTQYDILSSFSGAYPNSKQYALYYEIGNKNIKGLFFKAPNVIGNALEHYAIIKILEKETGLNLNGITDYGALAFNVTYLPVYNTRFTHGKPLITPSATKYAQIYNQTENLIETRYYGENVKGVAAKLGNEEVKRTYFFGALNKIPKCGKTIGEYKITAVDNELCGGIIKCTATMTKHYNNISQYVGISSIKRIAEVSERNAYARNVLLQNYIVVTKDSNRPQTATLSFLHKIQPLWAIFNSFDTRTVYGDSFLRPLGGVRAITYNDDIANYISSLELPVVSSAFGNVMTFTFSLKDNYSAGTKSEYITGSTVGGFWQKDVQYSDFYGKAKYLRFIMFTKELYSDLEFALSVPQSAAHYDSANLLLSEYTGDYVLDKDNREIPQITVALEFKTYDNDLIIGSALAKRCPLVTASLQGDISERAKLYLNFSNTPFNEFTNDELCRALLSGASYELTMSVDANNKVLTVAYNGSLPPCNGWAIITPLSTETVETESGIQTYTTGGELLIGSNAKTSEAWNFAPLYLYATKNI